MVEVLPNKKEIDIINEAVFEKYGTNEPKVKRHICVVCGDFVSIDDSYSSEGRRLICRSCFRKNFDSFKSLFDWVWD